MSRVFADTYFFLALVNPRDQAHTRAVAHAARLQEEMVTTAWVLTELADAMSAPSNRKQFLSTLRDLQANPQVRIIGPDANLFTEGIQLYAQRLDKAWSLTDCISFVVMQRESIATALTADHHFEQAGFTALLK